MELREHERWWQERGAAELRELLYRDWDPIGLKRIAEGSEDEYEAYAGQLARRLRAGASAEDIAARLQGFETDMGLEAGEPPIAAARAIVGWYRASLAG